MALVKCPSCGKERVSDTASSCPNCGYNIKEYYIRLNNAELIKNVSTEKGNIEANSENNIVNNNTTQYTPIANPAQTEIISGNSYTTQEKDLQTNTSSNKKTSKVLLMLIPIVILIAFLIVIIIFLIKQKQEPGNIISDTQLCKTVKTAMEIAQSDAILADENNFTPFKAGDNGKISDLYAGGTVYTSSFYETLGVNSANEVNKQIKSRLGKKTGEISYVWVSSSSVVVYIDNTSKDANDKKGYHLTQDNCKCIYAGPVELVPDSLFQEKDKIKQENPKQGSKHKNQTNKISSENKKENVTKPSKPVIDPNFYVTVSGLGEIDGVNVSWATIPEADGYEYSWCGWGIGNEVKHAGSYSGNMEYTTDTEAKLSLGYSFGGFSIVVRSYKLDGNNKIFSDWSDELFWNDTDDSYENQTDSFTDIDIFSIKGTEYYCVDNSALVLSINDEGNEAYIFDVDCGSCERGGPLSYISPGEFHVTEYDEPGQYSGDATIYFYEDEYGWDVFYCTDDDIIYEFR